MAGEILEGQLICRRHDDGRLEIQQAPPIARWSLELLAAVDPMVVKVSGSEIRLAGQVTYRVTGWDDLQACLVLERIGGGV